MTEPNASVGQAATDSTGATGAAPNGSQGQSVAQGQTTSQGPGQGEESFFDPKSIEHSPELTAAYKQMQAAWTKKNQGIKASQQKLDQYDQFMRDPIGSAQQVLSSLGYQVVQRDPAAKKDGNGKDQPWAPNSWDDVMAEAKRQVLGELKPFFKEVDHVKQQSMEARLDRDYPDWRTYEDGMVGLLKSHPTLAHDPDTLYRMAVPSEVLEARATKAALAKLKNGSDNAQVSGQSATTRQVNQKPEGKLTLNQAYEAARASLEKQGVRRPAG